MIATDPFPFICLETSVDGKVIYADERFLRDFPNNAQHQSVRDLFDVWETGKEGQLIHARRNADSFIFLKQEADKDRIFYVGIASKELESQLSELEELQLLNKRLDAVIESSYDGIYITDRNGVTIRTNSAIERITGIPKEYYLNKNVDALVKRGILEKSVTAKVIESKRSVSLVQLNHMGKETLLTGNPVFDEKGEVASVVTNIRDLSDLNHLQNALREAKELNKSYQKEIEKLKGKSPLIDEKAVIKNQRMQSIYDTARRIADVSATVLILGETGVGKDVLAKYIYGKSERSKSGKFIKVNCGAIPSNLLESELFGYDGGAFTGANKKGKPGMFEMADKGVLFLDEIGEMPLDLQVKLLRVIQEREIQRVGGTSSKKVDVRLIAATNQNLKEMVQAGTFREDLYYRLNVIPIDIPPLRERKEEIHLLVHLFLEEMNKKYGVKKEVDSQLRSFFYRYPWPGNIRELSNVIEQMVLLNREDLLKIEHLPDEYRRAQSASAIQYKEQVTLKEAAELAEERVLREAVNVYTTTYDLARALGTSQPTIVRKLKKYNISLKDKERART